MGHRDREDHRHPHRLRRPRRAVGGVAPGGTVLAAGDWAATPTCGASAGAAPDHPGQTVYSSRTLTVRPRQVTFAFQVPSLSRAPSGAASTPTRLAVGQNEGVSGAAIAPRSVAFCDRADEIGLARATGGGQNSMRDSFVCEDRGGPLPTSRMGRLPLDRQARRWNPPAAR